MLGEAFDRALAGKPGSPRQQPWRQRAGAEKPALLSAAMRPETQKNTLNNAWQKYQGANTNGQKSEINQANTIAPEPDYFGNFS